MRTPDLLRFAAKSLAGARTRTLLMLLAMSIGVASVVLLRGPYFVRELLAEMTAWLEENDFESVAQMRGSMNHDNCPNPAGFERLNYMKALMSYSSPMP